MILLTPGPANTSPGVKRALASADVCPREPEFTEILQRIRSALTQVVHRGDAYTSVLLAGSGTAGVEAAIASTVPADGRLLVIDNGAYGARMAEIAQAYGIPHDRLRFSGLELPDVDAIARALDAQHYSQLAVVHHETSTGMLNPVAAISGACHVRGVETIVDAISSYAAIPFEISELGADFLVGSSGKCVQAAPGLAFVICQRERLSKLAVAPGRSYYLDLARHHQFFERYGQALFTPPVPIVHALDCALAELAAEGGPSARHLRYLELWRTLDSGMRQLGLRRLLPEALLSRILTAYLEPDHPNYSFAQMHDRLYERGFTIYPGKDPLLRCFRLANMGVITTTDLTRFVAAMRDTLLAMGVHPLYVS